MGDRTFGTWAGGKKARRAFWGQPVWPAMVKVMFQADEPDTDAGEVRMTELAGEICQWMNQHGTDRIRIAQRMKKPERPVYFPKSCPPARIDLAGRHE